MTCPKCQGLVRIIALVEDNEVIKKILKHLGLLEIKQRPPPKVTGPPNVPESSIDYFVTQIPKSNGWLNMDPIYPEVPLS